MTVGSATHVVRPQWRLRVEMAARFVRVFALGATAAYPLVGAATAPVDPRPAVVAGIVAIAVAFHLFADVLNDVMDLPIDRTDPRRARSPLVCGRIGRRAATLFALGSVPVAFALVAAVGGGGPAIAWLAAACLGIGAYDVFGKAIRVPLVSDVVQGIGWASLVVVGAHMGGGTTSSTWLAAGYVTLYIVMVNGIHGAVRDLENDRRHGAATTALLLGARSGDGGLLLPPSVVALAAALHISLGAILAILVRNAGAGAGSWVGVGAPLSAVALFAVATWMLVTGYRNRDDRDRMMACGTWHLFLTAAALVAASLPLMPPSMAMVTSLAFVVPPKVFGWAVAGSDGTPVRHG